MSEDLQRENEALRARVAVLQEQVDAANRNAARALAGFQRHTLAMEVIRQKNEELDDLAAELSAARTAEEARATELQASNERLQASERHNHRLIAELQEAVAQLSTPILRVWQGVVALPILGKLDETRAAAITERTLTEVKRAAIRHVVLDLTGVDAVDARTAQLLLGLAHAVRLLGARCVLCGVRPHVAAALVEVTDGLGGLRVARDLHVALAEILTAR